MNMLSCDVCDDYETYKKDNLDLHVTMAHKYKKKEKSESNLAEKAAIVNGGSVENNAMVNGGSVEKKESSTPASETEPKPYVPRRRNSLFDCTKCIYRFLTEDGRDSHLENEHKPDDPDKDSPDHPDNKKKAEEAANNGITTSPTRSTYTPRGRTPLAKCPKCIYKFLSQEGLDSHLEKEHDPSDPDDENAEPKKTEGSTNSTYKPRRRSPLFDCKKCIFRFLNQEGLTSHLEKEHKPDDPEIR